jgi:hypothetical protein
MYPFLRQLTSFEHCLNVSIGRPGLSGGTYDGEAIRSMKLG